MDIKGIAHEYKDEILFIRFSKDELKIQDAERIIEIAFDLEESWDIEKVILMMTGVTYTNSTVISAIGRLADAKDLRIVDMHPKVVNIMETMGLLSFLELSPSLEEAVGSFEE